jgi:hypothetical protein
MFSLQQNWRRRGRTDFSGKCGGGEKGEVAQTMYTYMNKCKNN